MLSLRTKIVTSFMWYVCHFGPYHMNVTCHSLCFFASHKWFYKYSILYNMCKYFMFVSSHRTVLKWWSVQIMLFSVLLLHSPLNYPHTIPLKQNPSAWNTTDGKSSKDHNLNFEDCLCMRQWQWLKIKQKYIHYCKWNTTCYTHKGKAIPGLSKKENW